MLDLRLRLRGNPQGLAIVDRCLALLARAAEAEGPQLAAVEREVAELAKALADRFGPARPRVLN